MEYTFPAQADVSPGAKDFVGRLLKHNPMHRLPIQGVLCHPWVIEKSTKKPTPLTASPAVGWWADCSRRWDVVVVLLSLLWKPCSRWQFRGWRCSCALGIISLSKMWLACRHVDPLCFNPFIVLANGSIVCKYNVIIVRVLLTPVTTTWIIQLCCFFVLFEILVCRFFVGRKVVLFKL